MFGLHHGRVARFNTNLAKTDPKGFWQNIKKNTSIQQTKQGNVFIEDMFQHFNTLYGSLPPENQNDFLSISIIIDDELDSEFTIHEIRNAVFSQNNSKSPGTDMLIAEICKSSFDIISDILLNFYNKILEDGTFPELYEGIIVPIFKGCPDKAKKYRGITLNNILSKIYSVTFRALDKVVS